MTMTYKHGFTVIETMLFLAISGALTVAIMAGAGFAVNQQRYRESVDSTTEVLRSQYADVFNVQNVDRSATALHCNTTTAKVTDAAGAGASDPRGWSDCLIVGKYLETTDGEDVEVKTLVATKNNDKDSSGEFKYDSSNDLIALEGYNIATLPSIDSTFKPKWGATLAAKTSSGAESTTLAVMIIRVPTSGSIKTFVSTDVGAVHSDGLHAIIAQANIKDQIICVDSNGLFDGPRRGTKLVADAASADGVISVGDDAGC